MKRTFIQTATRTISLPREIVVEFPAEIHPDSVEESAIKALLKTADVEWEVESQEFDLDGTDWSDADENDDPDLYYEE